MRKFLIIRVDSEGYDYIAEVITSKFYPAGVDARMIVEIPNTDERHETCHIRLGKIEV